MYRQCPDCDQIVQMDAENSGSKPQCPFCALSSPFLRWIPATAEDQVEQSGKGRTPDPSQRMVYGVVVAASGIQGLMPRSSCVLRFTPDHIAVLADTRNGVAEIASIDYSDVDFLDISGQGKVTTTKDAGIIGGGFGLKGAVEGMAIAGAINAMTRRTTTTIDTVVDLKAGEREVLMHTNTFEPATLRVLLAPVYFRIEHGTKAVDSVESTPSDEPTQPS